MFFSRVKNIPKNLDIANPYFTHQFVACLVGSRDTENERYLYRVAGDDDAPIIFILSAQKPVGSDVLCEEYTPRFVSGEQVDFELRVNPVRTTHTTGKRCRHDIIMDAKSRMRESGCETKTTSDIIREEGVKWLAARAEGLGFEMLGSIWVGNYQRQAFYKGEEKLITFSTLDYSGTLTVINPEVFVEKLFSGIGHAKGFGCGLLMVKKKKSFEKMFFVTPHAVERYKEFAGCSAKQAIEDVLIMMQTAEEIEQQDGERICLGRIGDTEYGIVVADSKIVERWPAVITIIRTGSYEEIRNIIKKQF